MRRTGAVAVTGLVCAIIVACAANIHGSLQQMTGASPADPAEAAARATFPPGAEGDLIRYGHDLIEQTPRYLAGNISARMSCAACHPNAGRVPHQGSLLGVYAQFPQWNKRAKRFIALQDRIAECFLYSMNGRPPAYYSKEMIAMTAYLAFISRGATINAGFAGQKPPRLNAGPPNLANGAVVYGNLCEKCHQANGNGVGYSYPPLWGSASFNDRAGMSSMKRIAPFIRAAMPYDSPGTLTDQQAVDVAAFILAHPRPHFQASKRVNFPPEKASYF
jgi:thiosulfate dehydrogenase